MAEKNISFFVNQNLHSLARRLLKQIPAAIKNAQLYPLDHPYFIHSLTLLQETLAELFKYRPEATFNIVENELYFGSLALVEDSLNLQHFLEEFEKHKINNLTFLAAVTKEELSDFMQIMGREAGEGSDPSLISLKMKEKNIVNIELGAVIPSQSKSIPGADGGIRKAGEFKFDAQARLKSQGLFFGGIEAIKQIMQNVENDQDFKLDNVRKVVTDITGMIENDDQYLLGLTTIKNYDEYTFNHSVNVAILSLYLGKLLGLDQEQLHILGEAAILHDVGKVRVPKEILNKQGMLTADEWKIMENHTVEGAEILSKVNSVSEISLAVAFGHHLHYDLKGYPRTSSIKEINLLTSLVTICDVYDAATSLRVYHAPVLPAKVIALIISKKGSFFDPVLAKAFVQMMGIYPVGSLVRLDNNKLAVVYANNSNNILRPKVVLVRPEGSGQEPEVINLEEMEGSAKAFKYSIVEALAPQFYNLEITDFFYSKE